MKQKLSKHARLKRAAKRANAKYVKTAIFDDYDKQLRAENRLRDYEEASAMLMDTILLDLSRWCNDFCNNTPCSDCMTNKLIQRIKKL